MNQGRAVTIVSSRCSVSSPMRTFQFYEAQWVGTATLAESQRGLERMGRDGREPRRLRGPLREGLPSPNSVLCLASAAFRLVHDGV